MNIAKGIRRIGLIIGLLAALIFLVAYLSRTWRGISFHEHRDPTATEIEAAKLEANNENLFIWYRMLDLDPHHTLIPDRSFEEQKTFPDSSLVKDLYQWMDYSLYDDYLFSYMTKHAKQIHNPSDLPQEFVYSIYLARTIGVAPEQAIADIETYFNRLASQTSYAEKRHLPWTIENIAIAVLVSGIIFLAFWFVPLWVYKIIRFMTKYISAGFK